MQSPNISFGACERPAVDNLMRVISRLFGNLDIEASNRWAFKKLQILIDPLTGALIKSFIEFGFQISNRRSAPGRALKEFSAAYQMGAVCYPIKKPKNRPMVGVCYSRCL